MRLSVLVVIVVLAVSGLFLDVASAPACGCGRSPTLLVAAGTSPQHVPWRIRAMGDARAIEVDFSYLPPGADDAGYQAGLPFPLPKRFTWDIVGGSDGVGDEQDISGVTTLRVVRIVITLTDGWTVTTRPQVARHGAGRHRPWLRGLRFFDAFLPGSAGPKQAVAYDARGGVLARERFGS
jgi:hypothetical protein